MVSRHSVTDKAIDVRLVTLYPLAILGVLFIVIRYVIEGADLTFLRKFALTALSITVEALPFLVIGSLLSAVIHIYVSEETLARIIPKSRVLGVLAASLMGFVVPVCDCATVPIVRRLVGKGVPLHVAITFMLAVPMINPLVIFSTWFAFYQYPTITYYRMGFGLVAAVVVGLLVSLLDGNQTKPVAVGRAPEHGHSHEPARGFVGHVGAVAEHATSDLYDIGRYFMVGVILSSLVQSVVPSGLLYALGHNPILSVLVMVLGAYFLSICSQADAFIARTFMAQFSTGAIIAFLIFGPMMDMKNTLMLSTTFRKRFIVVLVGLIAVVSLASGYLLNAWIAR